MEEYWTEGSCRKEEEGKNCKWRISSRCARAGRAHETPRNMFTPNEPNHHWAQTCNAFAEASEWRDAYGRCERREDMVCVGGGTASILTLSLHPKFYLLLKLFCFFFYIWLLILVLESMRPTDEEGRKEGGCNSRDRIAAGGRLLPCLSRLLRHAPGHGVCCPPHREESSDLD